MATASPPRNRTANDPSTWLPRQDRHRPRGEVRPSRMGRRRAWVLIAVHCVILMHVLHWWLTGSSVTPVEPSEAMQTIELGRINAGFLLFAGLIASTLVFGRWFCGWACHVVALQDLCGWLLTRVGLRPRPLRSRLLVLGPWVVAGYMFVWPVVWHWLAPDEKPLPAVSEWELHLTTEELWVTFPGWIMATATFVVVGFLIVWWLGAKGFCTHGCPYGAFFALADRVAPMRIKVTDDCEKCGHCTSVCSSNVRVHEEVAKHGQVVDPGCMKCLDCVSVCPKDALYFGAGRPKPFAISQQRIQARADFSWPEEIVLALMAFGATQYAFRDAWFGEGVPLLLAVGTGVITAVFALLLWRLVRRRELKFQNTDFKRDGRFTRAGWLGLAGLLLWLGFAGHTAIAQRQRITAVESVLALREGATPARLEAALGAADGALAWDLVDDPRVQEVRGLVLRGLSRHADAERSLLAALNARGRLDYVEANLALAAYAMDPQRGRLEQARELVDIVLGQEPEHRIGRMLDARLRQLGK